jgi:hypothetical protein
MISPLLAFTGRLELWAFGGSGRPFAVERTNLKFVAPEYHAQAPVALALRDKVDVLDELWRVERCERFAEILERRPPAPRGSAP